MHWRFHRPGTLQDPALNAWYGRDEDLAAGQQALYRRAGLNSAASGGKYTDETAVGVERR